MKLPNLPDRNNGPLDQPYFDRQWNYLTMVLNGGITISDNLSAVTWSGTTGPVDTDFTVPHNLGRIPTGYLVLSIDAAGIVYKGSVAWTKTSLTLRCNIANANVTLVVL